MPIPKTALGQDAPTTFEMPTTFEHTKSLPTTFEKNPFFEVVDVQTDFFLLFESMRGP